MIAHTVPISVRLPLLVFLAVVAKIGVSVSGQAVWPGCDVSFSKVDWADHVVCPQRFGTIVVGSALAVPERSAAVLLLTGLLALRGLAPRHG